MWRPTNHLLIQIADGRAVLHVNGQQCLERKDPDFHPGASFHLGCGDILYPDMVVRLGNVRIHKWEPPKEDSAPKETEPKNEPKPETPVAKTLPRTS